MFSKYTQEKRSTYDDLCFGRGVIQQKATKIKKLAQNPFYQTSKTIEPSSDLSFYIHKAKYRPSQNCCKSSAQKENPKVVRAGTLLKCLLYWDAYALLQFIENRR